MSEITAIVGFQQQALCTISIYSCWGRFFTDLKSFTLVLGSPGVVAGGGKGLKTSDFNPGTTNLKGGPLPLGIVYLFPVIFVVIEVVSSDFQKSL